MFKWLQGLVYGFKMGYNAERANRATRDDESVLEATAAIKEDGQLDSVGISLREAKARPAFIRTDIIGRQGGRKRNRVHVYRRPYGLPIRLCDWVGVDNDEIDIFGTIPSGELVTALAILRGDYDKQICGHCWDVVHGIRGSTGMENLGHGKGAPLP